jgi:F420-non-reducing hydrogenase large subunit
MPTTKCHSDQRDVRVIDSGGKEFAKFKPANYLDYIAEHVEPWTYLKSPFLKKIGWKGLVESKDNAIYSVAPLARVKAADGTAAPSAEARYERMYQTLDSKPVYRALATHWARLIELRYAAERLFEIPLGIIIRNADGNIVDRLSQYIPC